MQSFSRSTYRELITEATEAQKRLFAQYRGTDRHFDVIVVGSGVGGGILADDLADQLPPDERVLVLEAGSYVFPTHIYNLNRFLNGEVASKYEVTTFRQDGRGEDSEYFIGAHPQLNLGGRSIFWSGLIPSLQPWELTFFPEPLRNELSGWLDEARSTLNASVTMGRTAQAIVLALQQDPFIKKHFDVRETPRALHQPYLTAAGTPKDEFWIESTGVFNTAELLIDQLGLNPNTAQDPNRSDRQRFQLLLNHYVESVERRAEGGYTVTATDTLADPETSRNFTADVVVLAAGSIESPKILRRSPILNALPPESQALVGRGLTDHPTTDRVEAWVDHIGGLPIPHDAHAKIIFYSRGTTHPETGEILYPFNIELNVNHEYWHLREDDPSSPAVPIGGGGPSRVEIKFSFGSVLDDRNELDFGQASPPPYVPGLRVKNSKWVGDLAAVRFEALAGWKKQIPEIWLVLNQLMDRILSQFTYEGKPSRPRDETWFNQGKGFGYGTVHHAVGTLRMPARPRRDAPLSAVAVVDENLQVVGHQNLYVCDMSVLPYSSAANPVLTLAALALRLSQHIRRP